MLEPYASRSLEKMKEVLMSPEAQGPEICYYMVRGGVDKTNITIWEVGKIGEEYIKTYGHYHVGQIDETYTVLQGEGVVLLQTRQTGAEGVPLDDQLEQFVAIKVKSGESVYIPSGTGHLVANTGSIWLVTSDNSPVNFEEKDPVSLPGHADYQPFQKMQGAGYYLVSENGQPTLIKNPKYQTLPEPIWLTPAEWNTKFNR